VDISNHREWVKELTHKDRNLFSKVDLYLDHQLDSLEEELLERSLTEDEGLLAYFHQRSHEFEKLEALIPRKEFNKEVISSNIHLAEVKSNVGEILFKRKKVSKLEFGIWRLKSASSELKHFFKAHFS